MAHSLWPDHSTWKCYNKRRHVALLRFVLDSNSAGGIETLEMQKLFENKNSRWVFSPLGIRPNLLSLTMLSTMPRSNLGRKVFAWFLSLNRSPPWGVKQRRKRNLDTGTKQRRGRNMLVLHKSRQQALEWHHPQWAGASHINHWSRKCPTDLSVGPSYGGVFSAAFPASHRWLWLVSC